MNDIKFYSTQGEYGAFSNFARYPIKIKSKVWPTSEHYFQAMKFEGTRYENEIRTVGGPMEAARKGRDRKLPLRKDWESIKNDIMLQALVAKFSQHKVLRDLLLSTGDSKLIEHTENDSYWGDGGNGKGKNMLGILLMKVRDILKKDEK